MRALFATALILSCASCAGGAARPAVGSPAPAFDTSDQNGARVRLDDLRGRPVVLYFYPKDGTPGCTREACAFRDAWQKIQATGAVILGVSQDSAASHRAFVAEHQLPFALLSDEDGSIAKRYGVGSFMGMNARVTCLIDRSGHVARVFSDVDPATHADQVLSAIAQLPAN
jgi:peroxiredoxin Q/BCP